MQLTCRNITRKLLGGVGKTLYVGDAKRIWLHHTGTLGIEE
jgi:hypothetical protein